MVDKRNCFLNIAVEMAKMSHCMSFHVAAIIVKDGRILSTGLNGTPRGCVNCDDVFSRESFDRESHHKFSLSHEIHAEMNAIIFAARNGISIDGADMYITMQPCSDCLKMLCNSGIRHIYYRDPYDKYEESEDISKLLEDSGITLERIPETDLKK